MQHKIIVNSTLGVSLFVCSAIAPVFSESVLMPFDEYMTRCTSQFGDDDITRAVCESQYRAIAQKEEELMAQTNSLTEEIWQSPPSEAADDNVKDAE
ncbi:hypothetical protein ABT56_20100 [Photobacterium aquae]|uniref:Uncharacterized protein n=1 Tax=Photobacterium aquae TaxID=1195763 RepID=A0A0J1GUK9_9GAMM|nr:hypothetical protein [Photobacterium aquae]KLV03420.1 hypothetical protein ABT56_20100 [Photobacterium aquae]